MKRGVGAIFLIVAILTARSICAQESNTQVELQARLGGTTAMPHNAAGSGFSADYLNLSVKGNITSQLSVTWRQRFNKAITANNPLNATDMLYIAYQPNANWRFMLGQQTLSIGGWEYDSAPINIYFASEFWNNIACYQLGIQAAYTNDKQTDTFLLQLNNSPFDTPTTDLYGAELMWYGTHGPYRAAHSVNIYEYSPGEFVYYLALGNKLLLDRVTLELDAMCRWSGEGSLFGSASVMGGAKWSVTPKLNILVRATYDCNSAEQPLFDATLLPGSELIQIGGGVEYFPLGTDDLRLHAIWSTIEGTNTNPYGTLQGGTSQLRVGATWYLSIL